MGIIVECVTLMDVFQTKQFRALRAGLFVVLGLFGVVPLGIQRLNLLSERLKGGLFSFAKIFSAVPFLSLPRAQLALGLEGGPAARDGACGGLCWGNGHGLPHRRRALFDSNPRAFCARPIRPGTQQPQHLSRAGRLGRLYSLSRRHDKPEIQG